MANLVFLDTGVVGEIINPSLPDNYLDILSSLPQTNLLTIPYQRQRNESIECITWLQNLLNKKECVVGMSEVSDYENRREHIRRVSSNQLNAQQKQIAIKAIQNLELLKKSTRIAFFPINLEEGDVMLQAAELWAEARNNGYQAFDADLIIAAQCIVIKNIGINVIIATTDTEDFHRILNQYHIEARRWKDIIM